MLCIQGPQLGARSVLVVEGYKKQLIKDFKDSDIQKEYMKLVTQNIPQKDVFKIIQSRYDIDSQTLYNITKTLTNT